MRSTSSTPSHLVWRASIVALLWAGAAFAEEQARTLPEEPPPLETRIEEKQDLNTKGGDTFRPAAEWTASSQPEDLLEELSGVSLARNGGPMAPVRSSMRGLSGPRTQTSWGNLTLDNPATGSFDVSFLPLFAAGQVSEAAGTGTEGISGSRLQIDPAPGSTRGLRAQVGWGTLQTMRAQLGAHYTTGESDTFVAALQVGRSDGNFLFRPVSPSTNAQSASIERQNNDQQRASLYLHGEQSVGAADLAWSAFGGAHRGGIPGFATAPTEEMRGETALLHSQVRLSFPVNQMKLVLQSTFRLGESRVHSPQTGQEERMSSSGNSVTGEIALPAWQTQQLRLDSKIQLSSQVSRVLGTSFRRIGYRSAWSGSLRLPPSKLRLDLQIAAAHFNDVGWLPEASIALSYSPFRELQTGIQLVQNGRPPTLDELYAPRGLVLGNPKLQMESGLEAEAYVRLYRNAIIDSRVSIFAGRMNDAIVFLNRNAFEILPQNTGPLLRAGWSTRTRIRPHSLLELRLSSTQLWTRMDVTSAPLPTIPPLFARLTQRLGPEDGLHLSVAMRYRARTFSSVHGTLAVPAYLLWDAIFRFPLTPHWLVSASLTNIADVQTAQDVNLLPLPGRQIFCSLEYRYDALL